MPILAVLGIGALVGLAGYLGYHAVKHIFFKDPWNLSWQGAGASLAAGAVALPAVLFGSGVLAGAAGLELTPLAIGGATSVVGAITGAVEDKKPAAPKPTAPAVDPHFNPFSDPAAVTTADNTATVDSSDAAPVASSSTAPVESSTAGRDQDPNGKEPGEGKEPPAGSHPVTLPPPPAPTSTSYTVQSGDTLTSIAREAGISLKALEQANPQLIHRKLPKAYTSGWDYIRDGEKITVPAPSKTPGLNQSLGQIGDPAPGTDQ